MLSVIIPTLNEAAALPRTLAAVQRLENGAAIAGATGEEVEAQEYEVFIVDGGSTDATRKVAEQFNVPVVKSERGLATQLMAGLTHAKGDTLLFLHADCVPPQDALLQIGAAVAGGVEAGAFAHRYDVFHPLLTVQSFINNTNARLLKRFSGEQGIFATKEALGRAGGVPETIVLECAKLSQALRRARVKTQLLSGDTDMVSSGRRFAKQSRAVRSSTSSISFFGIVPFLRLNLAHALHGFGVSDYKLKKFFPAVR